MYKESDFVKDLYKTGEVAKLLGVHTKTLQNYDREGKIKFQRSNGGHRIIFREDLLEYLDEHNMLLRDSHSTKRDIVYARVPDDTQKDNGELDKQALFIIENTNNLINPIIIKEVGDGADDKREELQKIIRMVMQDQVNNVYVTNKDRLVFYGFHILETVFKCKGVGIKVISSTRLEEGFSV
jgi:excisionase family DNA binding protein